MSRNTDRLRAVQALMAENKVDLLIVGPSADFHYLTGVRARPTARFLTLVLARVGPPVIITPKLVASTYSEQLPGARVLAWDDGSDPFSLVEREIHLHRPDSIGINDDLWASFLLQIQKRFPDVQYRSLDDTVGLMRAHKDETEMAGLMKAAARIDALLEGLLRSGAFVGQTEKQVQMRIRRLMIEAGFEDIGWIDVAAGPNGAVAIHKGSNYAIQSGDPIVIDFAGVYRGYWADICRTPVAGTPDSAFVEIYDVVLHAQTAAFEAATVGTRCEDVDRAARDIIEQAGYGDFFTHRVGHGLGLASHEQPYIVTGNRERLKAGMVFSIEPGIYIPGRWGVRVEDIVAVMSDGPRRLNSVRRDLVSVS